MRKFLILTLSGAAGYMFYPALAPALFGINISEQSAIVDQAIEPRTQLEKAPAKKLPKEEPAKPVAEKKPVFPAPMPEADKVAQVPVEEKPSEPDEPDLTSTDFELIIDDAVETGKYIDFRKDNIIEWKLLEQQFSKFDDIYQGEVSVEIGNLFGKSVRKAQVTIKDKKVTEWVWVETE